MPSETLAKSVAAVSSSELLHSLRTNVGSVGDSIGGTLSGTLTGASSAAAGAVSRARESSVALASTAASKARESGSALALAGVPVPTSLTAAAEREAPADPLFALCARALGACGCACPALSYQTRLMGFGVCFLLGFVLSLASLTSVAQLLLGNPRPFATKYTLGNLISIASSMFLMGPSTQCANMFHPDRRYASIMYLGSMAGTFVAVTVVRSGVLALLCVAVQMCALLWYVFSYIPYGRTCLKRCASSAVRMVAP